jgi:hypothetical protein
MSFAVVSPKVFFFLHVLAEVMRACCLLLSIDDMISHTTIFWDDIPTEPSSSDIHLEASMGSNSDETSTAGYVGDCH